MKQNVLNLLFILLIALCATAAAEKARFLAEDGDRAYHGRHLALHAGTEDCRICGNYLKVRARPDGNTAVAGHVEQADLVRLLEISGNWARVRVVYSAPSSPDSWTGLEGWVDAAYLECGCSERTYYAGGVDGAQGGEITAGAVNLRETASAKSRSLGKLERGERVRVLGQYPKGAKTFYRVVRTSGQSGFVSAEYLDIGGDAPQTYFVSEGEGKAENNLNTLGNDWKAVLDRYYDAIQDGDDTLLAEPYTELSQAAYLFKDVDGDGDEELLILDSAGDTSVTGIDDNNLIIACFTRKNGQIFHVFDGWTRNRYSLCTDGAFYNRGSNGAGNSIDCLLRLSGTKLTVIKAVYDQEDDVYYTDKQKAYEAWGDYSKNPVSLGAERITWDRYSEISEQMARKVLPRLSNVQYFRNYR